MVDQPSEKEMRLARESIDELKSEFTRKRNVSIALCAVFLVLATLVALIRLPMMSFCLLMVALIFLLRSIDASGQIDDVSRRSTKTLYPRMWMFDQKSEAAPSTQPTPKP